MKSPAICAERQSSFLNTSSNFSGGYVREGELKAPFFWRKNTTSNGQKELLHQYQKRMLRDKIGILSAILLVQLNAMCQVADIDGNTYPTVKDYKGAEWMAKNLNVSKFSNGDPIKECKTFQAWFDANLRGEPAWCYYDFDKANAEKYGKLYNYFAVTDRRWLAPKGWRVPNKEDFERLAEENTNERTYQGRLIDHLCTDDWLISCARGENTSEFNGLPAGGIFWNSSKKGFYFEGMGYETRWWCSYYYQTSPHQHWDPNTVRVYSEAEKTELQYNAEKGEHEKVVIKDCVSKMGFFPDRWWTGTVYPWEGFSVRCVKPVGFSGNSIPSLKVYSIPSLAAGVQLHAIHNTGIDSLTILSGVHNGKLILQYYNVPQGKFTRHHKFTYNKLDSQPMSKAFLIRTGLLAVYSENAFVLLNVAANKVITDLQPTEEGLNLQHAYKFQNEVHLVTFNSISGWVGINRLDAETGKFLENIKFHQVDTDKHELTSACSTEDGYVILFKKGKTDMKQSEAVLYQFKPEQVVQGKIQLGKFFTCPLPSNYPDQILNTHLSPDPEDKHGPPCVVYATQKDEGHSQIFKSLTFYKTDDHCTAEVFEKNFHNKNVVFAPIGKVKYLYDWSKQESNYFLKSSFAIEEAMHSANGDILLKLLYSSINEQSYIMYFNMDLSSSSKLDKSQLSLSRLLNAFTFNGKKYLLTEWRYASSPDSYIYFSIAI